MKATRRRVLARLLLFGGLTALVAWLACSFARAPLLPASDPDHKAIVEAVTAHAKEQWGEEATVHGFRIRARSSSATARFSVSDTGSQFAFWPYRATLAREEGAWRVTSTRDDQSWWWHLLNWTVGVK